MNCPRCGHFQNVYLDTCTRCGFTRNYDEWHSAVRERWGWCDRCRTLSLLVMGHTRSAAEGWECDCGRLLSGKRDRGLTPKNVFRESWSGDERDPSTGRPKEGPFR